MKKAPPVGETAGLFDYHKSMELTEINLARQTTARNFNC